MPEKYWVVVDDYDYEERETSYMVVLRTQHESVARSKAKAWMKFYQKLGYQFYGDEDTTILANKRHEIKIHVLQNLISMPQ